MRQFTAVLSVLFTLTAASAVTATVATSRAHTSKGALRPKITAEAAQAIANAKLPGAHVKAHELETEKGHLIYSFEFVTPGKSGIDEVNVDAMSGAVLEIAHEGPKTEKKEMVQEKHEVAKPAGHH